ncbi:MAG TPA: phosphate signaling complex protein PhoU [Spirochaetia bacterium]|nr:phosphate signaling complex protein PhoU [Spirochaetia bacterium]
MSGIRQHYLQTLKTIDTDIVTMGTLVEEAIQKSMTCLQEKDVELADRIILEDEKINALEMKIEDTCTQVIAQEQPVASDLRRIITVLKMVTQIERMGDHAVHIAKAVKNLAGETYMKPVVSLPIMADIATHMLHEVLTAFVENDAEKAIEIAKRDDKIDKLHNGVMREILTYMMQDPKNIGQSVQFIFISRYLERFGDHVTNISEWIVYNCTGKHVELNL